MIVIPWHVDWKAIHAIDNGGPWSTALAEKILRLHRESGAGAVRIRSDPSWLMPLYRDAGVKRLIGIDWNSLFIDFTKRNADFNNDGIVDLADFGILKAGFGADGGDANDDGMTDLQDLGILKEQMGQTSTYGIFLDYVTKLMTDYQPEIVFVDIEKSVKHLQHLPSDIRRIANETVGDIPILYYYGDLHFGIKETPCPALYYLWQEANMTPVEKLDHLIEHGQWGRPASAYNVEGGYPWISAFKSANNLPLGLIDSYDDWIAVCVRLKELGAKGFSMYPSPWSKEIQGLDNPINMRLIEFMRLGANVWRG